MSYQQGNADTTPTPTTAGGYSDISSPDDPLTPPSSSTNDPSSNETNGMNNGSSNNNNGGYGEINTANSHPNSSSGTTSYHHQTTTTNNNNNAPTSSTSSISSSSQQSNKARPYEPTYHDYQNNDHSNPQQQQQQQQQPNHGTYNDNASFQNGNSSYYSNQMSQYISSAAASMNNVASNYGYSQVSMNGNDMNNNNNNMGGSSMNGMGSSSGYATSAGGLGGGIPYGSASNGGFRSWSNKRKIWTVLGVFAFLMFIFGGGGSDNEDTNGANQNGLVGGVISNMESTGGAADAADAAANTISSTTSTTETSTTTSSEESTNNNNNNNNNNNSPSTPSTQTKINYYTQPTSSSTSASTTTSDHLKLVYLATYPRSGTVFNIKLLEAATNRSIATSYLSSALLVDKGTKPLSIAQPLSTSHQDNALPDVTPFWMQPMSSLSASSGGVDTITIPSNPESTSQVVLTHCHGYCEYPCTSDDYIASQDVFEESCRTIRKEPGFNIVPKSGGSGNNVYNLGITSVHHLQKVIRTVRDPYSLIVSRFHSITSSPSHSNYTPNMEGFHKWCKDVDDASRDLAASSFLSQELKEVLKSTNIPCHSEFYKYIAWHNHVSIMTKMKDYPTMNLYYEDYTKGLWKRMEVVVKMVEFLGWDDWWFHLISDGGDEDGNDDAAAGGNGIKNVEKRLPSFHAGKMYRNYYSANEIASVERFIRSMAVPDTMDILERYFVKQ